MLVIFLFYLWIILKEQFVSSDVFLRWIHLHVLTQRLHIVHCFSLKTTNFGTEITVKKKMTPRKRMDTTHQAANNHKSNDVSIYLFSPPEAISLDGLDFLEDPFLRSHTT